MSAQDRAIQKLAKELAGIKREVVSWRGPQADYTSIENGGNFTFKDGDGNVTAVVGGQDDGSNTIRHVDGPTPPIPSGLSAHVDGPIVQVSWDGSFEDADTATYDWSHLEVIVVGPSNEQLTATINDVTGASASVAATVSGVWTVVARSVSRAEKRSLDGDAGTVTVELVNVAGAIEAVQDSANGKNKVTYSSHAPTPADPGIFDDTWFVGQVGRPNDVVEATNIVANSSLETDAAGWSPRWWTGSGSRTQGAGAFGDWFYRLTATSAITGPKGRYHDVLTTVKSGQKWTLSIHVRPSRTISLRPQGEFRGPSGVVGSPQYGNYFACPAGEWTRIHMTITAVGDATTIRHQTYLHDATLQAGDTLDLDAEMIALGPLMPYFDGDTPSGETDNESHYRWTGEPHASTSEKYLPALSIGDSDNWNIIEQYRHDGAGWVKVELSHKVFSTVDLGKATVGELDGIRIMGQTVRGQQLSGDAIDGKVITGPTIQSARTGQRWVGDTTGIRIINEDDDVRTQLSPDGSTFKGEVEADTLVVNEGAELKANNTLAQGAKLTLAAGVTDPTSPPVVQPYWDSLELDFSAVSPRLGSFVGLAFDGTHYWTFGKVSSLTNPNVPEAYRVDASGVVAGFSLPGAMSEAFGVTCIGSELFWLYRSGYQAFVLVTDLDCVKLREWEYPHLGHTSTNPLGHKPGIGNDGTNIVIAQCDDAGPLNIRTYNKTTGALISRAFDTGGGTRSDITGVYVGNADWGRKLNTVAQKRTDEFTSFNPSTGAYDGDGTKFNAAATGSTGVVFVDGKFRTLDPTGKIHEYADRNTGDASGDWWATYYWYTDVDDDSVIESSDYQSRMSPPKRFTWPRRAQLKILGQPMPEGVEALGPALAKKTTTPERTDFSGPGWQMDAGKSSARYIELPTNWTTYGSPSATNTFPEAESSVLESASGTFRVQGDGSGHWGPLTMGRNGVMSGLIATGQVSCAVNTAGTPKKFTVQLPAGRFTKPPVVWLSPLTSSPQNVAVSVVGADITTTSFDLWFWRNDLSGTGVDWFAMDSE